ncbi:hypothetical protein [Actinomycetospora termitidis]|uniref:Zinc-finger domain-containing protein n=1 Tax=Actinomycetospora termitidis TaxID=3053470 RepID=A0ABT7M743_9PSEU|nr:hypothetical protein [Actinomycetospora sp. Odt1-22]MDL5156487.1 hypothetical protein [Actinomycetospora sp. Odt1-22]
MRSGLAESVHLGGNRTAFLSDTDDVECERCREVTSADLDGEATAGESRAAEAHRQQCAACREWLERAAAVTRRARTRPAAAGPDLVDGVLDALDRGWPVREAPAVVPESARRLVLLVGGEAVSECGCAASCSCGCQQGRPCRCGDHRAA